jgi:hypothetical protein
MSDNILGKVKVGRGKQHNDQQGTESTKNNTRTDGIQLVAAHKKAPRGRQITQSKNGVFALGSTWQA